MTRISAAAAGFALALATLSTSIARAEPDVAVAVEAQDLDSPRDAQVLLGRLGEAAMEACGAFQGSLIDYRWAVSHSTCYRAKLDAAVAQVDSPILSRLYDEEGPLMLAPR
jgi:UrcA family protein